MHGPPLRWAMPRHSVPVTEPQTLDVYTARGPVEGEDWIAVARALNERMAALRLGQQELAQRSGISVSTLRKLQHGAGRRVQNKTLAAISTALDWPADHLAAVLLADRTPPSSPQTVDADPISDRLQRIEEHLRQVTGQLATIEALLRAFTR
jgi:DNA-binding Xre family transcriptional regulator